MLVVFLVAGFARIPSFSARLLNSGEFRHENLVLQTASSPRGGKRFCIPLTSSVHAVSSLGLAGDKN